MIPDIDVCRLIAKRYIKYEIEINAKVQTRKQML
jgi:hypothetical protein